MAANLIPNGNQKTTDNSGGLKRFGSVKEVEKTKGSSKVFTDYYIAIYLFLVASFVASAMFIHRPLITQIKMTNAETQNQLIIAENERGYLQSVEGSVAAAQSIPSDILRQVEDSLPEDQNIPSLLVQFGAAALANSVSIDTIAFVEPKLAANGQAPVQGVVVPMDISMVVRAPSYFEMKRFLGSVENSLRLMDVQSITLSSVEQAETSFSIMLRVYTYQPPAAQEVRPNVAGEAPQLEQATAPIQAE
jgi:Tfp pilus assembly protein PilO